ncbi:uncharacterized protein LOC112693547 isoform X2 [Sipha flava]|uniref:Uncharacterized protein LOC112693547 isoform X2 n=1 Tax=Sipha flava TaxID=143950 RepID=A0A8B8GN02_9HEMI|nr:uncharacterized protein LOC112693547 isoform X2 [Sipha flava]
MSFEAFLKVVMKWASSPQATTDIHQFRPYNKVNHRPSAGAERIEMSQTVMEFMQQLWLALVMAWYLQAYVEADTIPRQNAFVELDSQLLDRIEITTEEIARNSTRDGFVDHEIQAMIDLFINNLNITIDELRQYSNHRNSSNFDDTKMKEFQKKGLIMYENTAITVEYIVFKINVLSKSTEELEQLEKYIIDEEKRLKDVSNNSLEKKIKSVLDKIQTTKRFIGKHVNHLNDINNVLKDLSVKLMNTLKVSINSNLYRFVSQVRAIN